MEMVVLSYSGIYYWIIDIIVADVCDYCKHKYIFDFRMYVYKVYVVIVGAKSLNILR